MKYYEYPNHGLIAIQNDNESLDVYCSHFIVPTSVKFTAPGWYAEQLRPLLTEISKERFDICYSFRCRFNEYTTIDLENIDLELYHGTDAKVVRMTDDERKAHKTFCKRAIEYLYPLYLKTYYDSSTGIFSVNKMELDNEINVDINRECLGRYRKMLRGHQLYQYPDNVVYLATLASAESYARKSFAGGEFGYIAYFLIKTAQNVELPGFDPDPEMENAIQHVLEFGEQKKEPVIFRFTINNDIDIEYLRDENGEFLPGANQGSFRYIGPIKLDLAKAEYLK
ncbi:MAG: hypothetical protein IKW97_07740 [Muribaculaceae bacterium]|nr:hypothetical protein [Muribaculaceae bacterium]